MIWSGVRITAAAGLAVVVVVVLVITLWPTPVDPEGTRPIQGLLAALHGHGMPAWFGFRELEFSANIVMFVPLGVFTGLLIPRRRALLAAIALPLLSIAVEVAQLLFLPERYPAVSDVIANSLGAWAGLALSQIGRPPAPEASSIR